MTVFKLHKFKFSSTTFLLFLTLVCTGQSAFLNTPIEGVYGNDYFLVNYMDWSFDSVHDAHCGSKSYDGHFGSDFVIRNFSQMDQGVAVLAAASGKVCDILNDQFDRNKMAVSGGFGNYICIQHPNKYYSYYAHLKKNSARVNVGDIVTAGQPIAEVGSSGYSSDPHLHFELWYDSSFVVDPFAGNCGNSNTLWLNPLDYVDSFGIIDFDLCNFQSELEQLKERIPSQKVFGPNDEYVNFWMQGYGFLKGSISKVRWFTPQQDLWFEFEYRHPVDLWYGYFWTHIFRPPLHMTGTWTVDYSIDGNRYIVDSFTVANTVDQNDLSNNSIDFKIINDKLFISTASFQKSFFSLVNVLGQMMPVKIIEEGKPYTIFDTSHLPSGMYILAMTNRRSFCFFKS